MDNNLYPKIYVIKSIWIIVYTIIFFIIINLLVAYFFRNTSDIPLQIETNSSYVSIEKAINAVKKSPGKKIIFIGGSALRGGRGVSIPEQVTPYLFNSFIAKGVTIYNFSFPSAKPLDQFLFFWLLNNTADLYIVDVNTLFFESVYAHGVVEDYTKYNRINELLLSNAGQFLKESPEAEKCLSDNGILPQQKYSFSMFEKMPIVAYKDEINSILFGKNFSLFFDSLISAGLDFFKTGGKQTDWVRLFKPPMEVNDQKPFSELSKEPLKAFEPSLNSCILHAFAIFVARNHKPVVFYISPHSQFTTQVQRKSSIYNENLSFIESQFTSSTTFFDLDKTSLQPVTAEGFADEVHFNILGHQQFSRYLYELIKKIPAYAQLFD